MCCAHLLYVLPSITYPSQQSQFALLTVSHDLLVFSVKIKYICALSKRNICYWKNDCCYYI